MITKQVLEENVKQLNEQYYASLRRITELNEEVFGLKQVRDVATDLIKEYTVSNLTTMIETNHAIVKHLENLKTMLDKN